MDDLSPELRLLVESARRQVVARADKHRLWNRLEAAIVEERVRSKFDLAAKRARVKPFIARYAWAALCLAGLTLAVEGHDSVVPREAELASARPAAAQPREDSAPAAPSEAEALPSKPERSKRRAVRTARADVRGKKQHAFPNLAVPVEAPVARPQPARTRLLAQEDPNRGSSSSAGAAAPERVFAEAFREKLVSENYARYQAALAEHARTASVRRNPSTVGGYAAW